jgi:WD40 repeat protein
VAYSPDGSRLAAADMEGTVWVWDAATGQRVFSLRGHRGPVHQVAFSRDGTRLASGSEDRTIKVWDLATGREIRTLTGHTRLVYSVAFSPDGQRLASGTGGVMLNKRADELKIWDLATGKETLTLTSPGAIESLTFSADGRRLITPLGGNGAVQILDAQTGQKLLAFRDEGMPELCCLALHPDQTRIATPSPGGVSSSGMPAPGRRSSFSADIPTRTQV